MNGVFHYPQTCGAQPEKLLDKANRLGHGFEGMTNIVNIEVPEDATSLKHVRLCPTSLEVTNIDELGDGELARWPVVFKNIPPIPQRPGRYRLTALSTSFNSRTLFEGTEGTAWIFLGNLDDWQNADALQTRDYERHLAISMPPRSEDEERLSFRRPMRR